MHITSNVAKFFDHTLIPVRVVIAGDWHANRLWAVNSIEHIATHYPDVDLILHVGDFGYDMDPVFLEIIQNYLEKNSLNLAFIDGNHDNHDYLRGLKHNDDGLAPISDRLGYITRGMRWNWWGKTWLGLGGAHSIDMNGRLPGISWWSGEEINEADIHRAVEPGRCDVMLAHDVPTSVELDLPDRSLLKFRPDLIDASQAHRDRLQTVVDEVCPSIMFAGHFHRRRIAPFGTPGGPSVCHVLDCDNKTMSDNMVLVDCETLAVDSIVERADEGESDE